MKTKIYDLQLWNTSRDPITEINDRWILIEQWNRKKEFE